MSRLLSPGRLALLLTAGYLAILVWNAGRVGLTVDEPTRLLTGYLYWLGLPDHHPKDQPPLLSVAVGWAPRLLDMPLFADHEVWQRDWKEHVSSYILDRMSGPEIDRVVFWARTGAIVFPLLTILVLWRWSRQLFSPWTALLVLLIFFLTPSLRAHGALITSDLAATFAYLWFGYEGWRFLKAQTRRNLFRLSVACGIAVVAKFSLIFVPVLGALLVLGYGIYRRSPRWMTAALVPLLAAWLISIAFYRFDTRRLSQHDFSEMSRLGEFPPLVLQGASIFRYIPTAAEMQTGVRTLGGNQAAGNPVFLFGRFYRHGHWLYFPACLALKLPIAVQILVLGGLLSLFGGVLAAARTGHPADPLLANLPPDRLWLIVPPLIYLLIAMQSSVQLGIRLILPGIAYLILLSGFAIEHWRRSRAGTIALAGLLCFLGVSTARIFPHDLAYFNEWAGGPENGWRYLSDSNIDWGNNLPELRRFMEQEGLSKIKLFGFGFDKSHRYFPADSIERMPVPWTPRHVSSSVWKPEPGIYAVSLSLIWGQMFSPGYQDYLSYFRDQEPISRPGYGLAVYEVLGCGARSNRPPSQDRFPGYNSEEHFHSWRYLLQRLTSLTIFFPTYRDAPVLPSLIRKAFEIAPLCAEKFEIVPVNDGSPDETGDLLKALQAQYGPRLRPVTHPVNRGYGGAVKTGFKSARMEFIFYTDGDCQYDLDDLPKLVAKMDEGIGLVNGYKIERSDSILRRILGSLYLFAVRHAFWVRIHDVDCDFRLVRASVMRQVNLVSDSGAICVELVRKIQNTGCGIAEVPVSHLPRTHGTSQFFRLSNLWKMVRDDCRMFWTLMILRRDRPSRVATAEEVCVND